MKFLKSIALVILMVVGVQHVQGSEAASNVINQAGESVRNNVLPGAASILRSTGSIIDFCIQSTANVLERSPWSMYQFFGISALAGLAVTHYAQYNVNDNDDLTTNDKILPDRVFKSLNNSTVRLISKFATPVILLASAAYYAKYS